MTRGASADESGPLRGPFRCAPVSPGHTDLRPVRPGVTSSQGLWPCTGLRPALQPAPFDLTSICSLRPDLQPAPFDLTSNLLPLT